jgi:hypothetical protein
MVDYTTFLRIISNINVASSGNGDIGSYNTTRATLAIMVEIMVIVVMATLLDFNLFQLGVITI